MTSILECISRSPTFAVACRYMQEAVPIVSHSRLPSRPGLTRQSHGKLTASAGMLTNVADFGY